VSAATYGGGVPMPDNKATAAQCQLVSDAARPFLRNRTSLACVTVREIPSRLP
jgi:hypothetical protein